MSRTASIGGFLALLIVATARIVATYSVFNDTVDESWHIGCGMVWLSGRVYDCNPEHPPLARGMMALGPYLAGARDIGETRGAVEGRAVLNHGGNFDRMLALARMGILPFFWLAALAVYLWTRRGLGEPAAFFATLCFTMFPSILAHAGLATTDMPAVGSIGAAFLAMLVWLEYPGFKLAVLFGASLALAALSKFTSLAFLPAAALCFLIWVRPSLKRALPTAAVVAACAALMVWAGYRFHFNRVPAPELWQGIRDVISHNDTGHPGYLLGQFGTHGWWYYYPVAMAVKTPLALLVLIAVGISACWKRRVFAPLAFTLGILLFAAIFSHINLGIRHILPAYVGLCVAAGAGAAWMWSAGPVPRFIAGALLLWLTVSSARSHPDYLAYFNELAGKHPENILVDSDLDWGQDMKRLAARMRQLDVKDLAFDPFNGAYIEELQAKGQFPAIHPLDPQAPSHGWNAASITMLKLWRMGTRGANPPVELWTDRIPPTERVGRGVWLWYVP